jgi:(p)ppGpp synthase/HD superfamily hydrolase
MVASDPLHLENLKTKETQMGTLEHAINISAKAHEGQRDKAGAPYIFHPLRLMMRMTTSDAQIVAILHDVVEDSQWTIEALRDQGFSDSVLAAVDLLTKPVGCSYPEYVRRIKPNPLAASVKVSDLEDNLNLTRLPCLTPKDIERIQKYHAAWVLLTGN